MSPADPDIMGALAKPVHMDPEHAPGSDRNSEQGSGSTRMADVDRNGLPEGGHERRIVLFDPHDNLEIVEKV